MNSDLPTIPLSRERLYGPNGPQMDLNLINISQRRSLFYIICWKRTITSNLGPWISICIKFAWIFIKLILLSSHKNYTLYSTLSEIKKVRLISNIILLLRLTVSPVSTMRHHVLPEIFKQACSDVMNAYAIKELMDFIESILSNNSDHASVYSSTAIRNIIKEEHNKLIVHPMDILMSTIKTPDIFSSERDSLKAIVMPYISKNIECIEKEMLIQVKQNLEYIRCKLLNIEDMLQKLDYLMHLSIPATTNISFKWEEQSLPEAREIFHKRKHNKQRMKLILCKCKYYLILQHQHTSFKIHALEHQLNAISNIANQTETFFNDRIS